MDLLSKWLRQIFHSVLTALCEMYVVWVNRLTSKINSKPTATAAVFSQSLIHIFRQPYPHFVRRRHQKHSISLLLLHHLSLACLVSLSRATYISQKDTGTFTFQSETALVKFWCTANIPSVLWTEWWWRWRWRRRRWRNGEEKIPPQIYSGWRGKRGSRAKYANGILSHLVLSAI